MARKLQDQTGTWEEPGAGVGGAAVADERADGGAGRPGTVTEDQVEDGPRPQDVPAGVTLFVPEAEGEVVGGDRRMTSEGAKRETAGVFADGLTGELEDVPEYTPAVLERMVLPALVESESEPLLDAWYATLGDDALAAALARPSVREALEVVIGADDRTRINNTTDVPWRMICSLRITAGDGSGWIGTGWLVAPRTVITAGHCVYIANRGGWVRSIDVIPGRNGAAEPLGRCTSHSFRSVLGWTQSGHRNYDYGAIILPRTCGFGRLGGFGFASLSDASLRSLRLNLSGYPGDKPPGTQWYHARTTKSVTPRTIVYDIDTAGGQSGAPVWRNLNGTRHAVGIHTNGALSGNSATRIVPPVFNNLQAWKTEGA